MRPFSSSSGTRLLRGGIAVWSVLCAMLIGMPVQAEPAAEAQGVFAGQAMAHESWAAVGRRGQRVGRRITFRNALALADEVYFGPIPEMGAHTNLLIYEEGEKHWLRMGLETAMVLTIGNLWYWFNIGVNSKDWDWPAWNERISSTRFDNNSFHFNNWFHPLAGMATYTLSRANHLNPLESYFVAIVMSTSWEMISEFPERPSINDLIVTPTSGVGPGEFWHQLGVYLSSSRMGDSVWNDIAGFVFGVPDAFHQWMDEDPDDPPEVADHLGYDADIWHRFAFLAGAGAIASEVGPTESRAAGTVLFDMELVSIPGFLTAGRRHGWFFNGNQAALWLDLGIGDDGLQQVHFRADATLLGYIEESLHRGREGLEGISAILGISSSFEVRQLWRKLFDPYDFVSRNEDRQFQDANAMVHILGPWADVRFLFGGSSLQLRTGAYLDFASVTSLAFPRVKAAHPDETFRSILEEWRYYYGFGGTMFAEIVIEFASLRLTGRGTLGGWTSLDALDRYQEEITLQGYLRDREYTWLADLQYHLGDPFSLVIGARADGRYHTSKMNDLLESMHHIRVLGLVGVEL